MLSRRSLLAAGAGVAGIVGLAAAALPRIELWRYVEFTDPVSLTVENYEVEPHAVAVLVTAPDGSTVHEGTYDVDAADGWPRATRVEADGIVEEVGRYHVVGELADGTTDEYTLEPLDVPVWGTRMPDLVVSIGGETGRLWVGGAGGKP